MKKLTAATCVFFLALGFLGCADTSPRVDYVEFQEEHVLASGYTLNGLIKKLEEKFGTVVYEENQLIKAGPLNFYLEKNNDALIITKTTGELDFIGLMSFGQLQDEEGNTFKKFIGDGNGIPLLRTGPILEVYLNE